MQQIRRAVYDDIPQIMEFIDKYWKQNHILARNREFFEWMYVGDGEVNFYVVDEDGRIIGINGLVFYNHLENPSISGALWKVKKNPNPMLGLQLAEYIWEEIHNECSYGIGMNPKTAVRIARLNGDEVRIMDHYYRLRALPQYNIAVVHDRFIPQVEGTYQFMSLETYEDFEDVYKREWFHNKRPYKEDVYFKWRYYDHPIYCYKLYAIVDESLMKRGVIIFRKIECNQSAMLKIVDFIGEDEAFANIGQAVDELLKDQNCEYVDIFSTGLSKEVLCRAGFINRRETDNIIPNYFEPFEQKNVDIYCGAPSMEHVYLYRGDGDQDRPN